MSISSKRNGWKHNNILTLTIPKLFHANWGSTVAADVLLSGGPDYFYRNKISSSGDLSHYSSASLY